jgi:hypothetical protein
MDWFYEILQDWKEYYYTEPFEIICLTIALFTGLFFAKKEPVKIVFLIYIMSGLLSMLYIIYITQTLRALPTRRSSHISMMTLIVSYIEMSTFMFFFYNTLLIKAVKIFIKLSFVTFTIVNFVTIFQVLFSEISIDHLRKSSYSIISFQLFPLLFLCFSYYYQILNFKSVEDLFRRPSFWITTSLFFYILLLIPFLLIYEELRSNHKSLIKIFFSIHYFAFGIIFIALTNAFLCKKPITT